jgi:hypothetical protein
MRKILFLLISFLFVFQAIAATLRCSVCDKKIRGRYLKSNGKVFCSEKCFNQTKPVCAACGKHCTQGAYKKNDKFYCSKKCLETTLPKCALCEKPFRKGVVIKTLTGDKVYCEECASLPKCFACGLPAASGTYLKDGRFLGEKCGRTAIFSESEALKLFDQVRKEMREELKIGTNNKIYFHLVNQHTLKKSSSNYEPGMEMGLFKHNYTLNTRTETNYSLTKGKEEITKTFKTNDRYSISLLTGLPKNKFIEVCAHELAHDWMDTKYPNIKSLKIKEGWAEYVATRVNDLYGQSFMNKRMEANTSAIYGDGYRFIRDYVKQHGFQGLLNYFKAFK